MKYNKQILGTLVLMSVIVPQAMFAATTTVKTQEKGARFCENVGSFLANSEAKMATKEVERNTKIAGREAEVLAKRLEKDQKVSDLRAEALVKQDAKFNTILAKASTTEQKAAISEFISAVKSAVSARQASVDALRNTYRTSADQVIADRKAKMEAAITARKTAVELAVAKAKTDCASGVDSLTVKSTLQASIKGAAETFKSTIQNLGKGSEAVKALGETRKIAANKVHTDFKAALEALKVTLKTKLGAK